MYALYKEMISTQYDLSPLIFDLNTTPQKDLDLVDMWIVPADRSELCLWTYQNLFLKNRVFCHFLAGSQSYSYTHDDVNRWMLSLMANFCFAESPQARDNLVKAGIPEDRTLITGTSHFDGITAQDIEVNKPKDAPNEPYDIILMNPETQTNTKHNIQSINHGSILINPNEDAKNHADYSYPHLEFLWLLHHADHFISNSSAGIYELPYLQKYYGSKCKWVNLSQRNRERTPISPEYCRGASVIIGEWAEKVDLDWLRTPKRLFQTKSFPSGY